MRLKITVTGYIEVSNLDHYNASSIQEAAKNQQAWLEEGDACPLELLDFAAGRIVEVVGEE